MCIHLSRFSERLTPWSNSIDTLLLKQFHLTPARLQKVAPPLPPFLPLFALTPSPTLLPLRRQSVANMSKLIPSQNTSTNSVQIPKNSKIHWSEATENDIQRSLGGDSVISVGDFVGRSEYYISDLGEAGKEFVKVLLRDSEDDNVLRRVSGENLARKLFLPSHPPFQPLVSSRTIESYGYPGDYYVVTEFREGTQPLSPDGSSIEDISLYKLGEFIQKLESTELPMAYSGRKASDPIEILFFLSDPERSSVLPSLPRGGGEVLSILRAEGKQIRELVIEARAGTSQVGFSHGDLKLSQLLQSDDGAIFLCDWEECGAAPVMNDLAFLASDLFYSQIRSVVDEQIENSKRQELLQVVYDTAVSQAIDIISPLIEGYLQAKGKDLSRSEKRTFEIRLGLGGLMRLYTVSAKSNSARPRELALASIGMQMACGHGLNIF